MKHMFVFFEVYWLSWFEIHVFIHISYVHKQKNIYIYTYINLFTAYIHQCTLPSPKTATSGAGSSRLQGALGKRFASPRSWALGGRPGLSWRQLFDIKWIDFWWYTCLWLHINHATFVNVYSLELGLLHYIQNLRMQLSMLLEWSCENSVPFSIHHFAWFATVGYSRFYHGYLCLSLLNSIHT